MHPNRSVLLAVAALAAGADPALAAGTTERVSVGPDGVQGNAGSFVSSVSADGHFVAFNSDASNLVPDDTNGKGCRRGSDPLCGLDVFVRDRKAGTTELVSVPAKGVRGGLAYGSFDPSISANGRYVAFASTATDLVPDDTNGATTDVFVRDREAGTTELVSVSSEGVQGDGVSYGPSITPDGRFVAFQSFASNLVPDDTNRRPDVFVRDRLKGTTERVSVGPGGRQGNGGSGFNNVAISKDGRFVAFPSFATNLVPGGTSGVGDVFVRDRKLGRTELVSVGLGGRPANADSGLADLAMSADGRFVTFPSDATNLVPGDVNGHQDVFVRDRKLGRTELVSVGVGGQQANDGSGRLGLGISADGRLVTFQSYASNLVPGDTNDAYDVFVRDRRSHTTEQVDLGPRGVQGNLPSWSPAISADGHFVSFASYASNLVPGDTNRVADVFIRHIGAR